MKAYRFFWRAYAVILLMIRHYLIAARLSDGGPIRSYISCWSSGRYTPFSPSFTCGSRPEERLRGEGLC